MFSNKGQVVVEYALLMIVSVGIAMTLVRTTVNRDPESQGFIIIQWEKIITAIGEDTQE